MGLFGWLERKLFLGEVVREFGSLGEDSHALVKSGTSAMLCRRKGRVWLVIRQSHRVLFAFGVNYIRIPMTHDLSRKLGEMSEESLRLLRHSSQ